MTPEFVKDILAAALLTAGEPLSIERLQGLFEATAGPSNETLRKLLEELRADYQDAPVVLTRVAGGYRFVAHARVHPWLVRLYQGQKPRPSRALLETLSIIAYRQPITRAEIEEIRGVAVSSHILKTLEARQWVRVLGHRETPGRPALLGTTPAFLAHFGLEHLAQLPPLDALKDLEQIGAALAGR